MSSFRRHRVWFWIAVAAIAIALIALLVPHTPTTSADQSAWLALLPVFFIGLIAPLCLLLVFSLLSLGHTPEPPALAPSFQRPPPFFA